MRSPNTATDADQAMQESIDPRRLAHDLKAYHQPSTLRSWVELAITLLPFVATFTLLLFAIDAGYWLALALIPLAGLLLLRLFIIQHDCGHGAFLSKRGGNDWVGRALGVLTLTPYDCWRRSHALHHAATGNLDARGFGDVDTLTVREFQERGALARFGYRLYRHPAFLLGFGPAYLFLLRHRLPIGLMREGMVYWVSAMATNAVIVLIMAGLVWAFSLATVAIVFFPTLLVAASMGVWLFYIQHQFENAVWDRKEHWSFHQAALEGSSYLHLPAPLRWFTGNIGIHHVHHLASRVPFYRLPEVLREHPRLQTMNRFTIGQTFKPLMLALWDEDERRLVTFREAKRLAAD